MNKLEVSNISKSFDGRSIINNVSFSIKEGTFTVLLGPSGCGKSTILRMVAGLEKPDLGKIVINGKDVTSASPSKRELSMVFQSYALFPYLNVKDNILFGLKVRKVKKEIQEEKLKEVIKLVDLKEVLYNKASQLSGGQKQRVALARAIISGHSLCLMDEPLSNLDAKLRGGMRIELRTLQKKLGISVLYVTHDQTEAMSMADHIILLNNGKIEQQGTPFELYDKSNSIFVSTFIGTPPMNIIKIDATTRKELEKNFSAPFGKNIEHIGIRPEDVKINQDSIGIPGSVLFLDYHGSDMILGIKFENMKEHGEFLARIQDRKKFKIGDKIWINLDEEKVNLFDLVDKRLENTTNTQKET